MRSRTFSIVESGTIDWSTSSNGKVTTSDTTVGSHTTTSMCQTLWWASTIETQELLVKSMRPRLTASRSRRQIPPRGGDQHVKAPCLRRGGECKGTSHFPHFPHFPSSRTRTSHFHYSAILLSDHPQPRRRITTRTSADIYPVCTYYVITPYPLYL
jgi:hypothetical protein